MMFDGVLGKKRCLSRLDKFLIKICEKFAFVLGVNP